MSKQQVNLDLYKTGVVADLTFSRWGAKTKLKAEDLGLKDIPEDLIHLGRKRLVPKDRMAKIASAISEARVFVSHNSFSFPFGDVVFIPYARLQKVVEKVHKCEKDFWEGVEGFYSEYGEIREKMMVEYEKAFDKILKQKSGMTADTITREKQRLLDRLAEKYPPLSELKKKFGFDFVLFEIKTPDFESISSEEALDKVRITHEIEESYKRLVERKLDQFLEGVVEKLKTMVLDMVEKLKYRIEKETISMASVKSFRKFADAFRSLDFVDTSIDQAISQLEEKLDKVEKSDLNDEQFRDKLNTDLDSIKKLTENIDFSKVLGRFKRKIRVEEVA